MVKQTFKSVCLCNSLSWTDNELILTALARMRQETTAEGVVTPADIASMKSTVYNVSQSIKSDLSLRYDFPYPISGQWVHFHFAVHATSPEALCLRRG